MIVKENFSLKNLNTFGVDVKTDFFISIKNNEDLKKVFLSGKFKHIPKLILGGGSNILFTKDFKGLIIQLSSNEIKMVEENNDHVFIEASAGVIWHDLVLFCVNKNFGGIENLSLIPGKTGAAPIQNIGAYGQELKDTFYSLKGILINDGTEEIFYKDDCDFGYRSSIFKKELKNKFAITDITLKLNKHPVLNTSYGAVEEELKKLNKKKISIKDVSDVVCKIRMSKLPDPKEIGNAGSFFKNPEIPIKRFENLREKYPEITGYKISDGLIKISAGWLIEKVGLKGIKIGNTGTHKKQALVIVNYGNADGEEILKFKDFIKSEVFKSFEIELEEEVNVI